MARSIDGVIEPNGGFQQGGWYNGRQYWDGQLGAQGVIINPNQVGFGQAVSAEVQKQSNPNAPVLGNPQQQVINNGQSNVPQIQTPQTPTIDVNKLFTDNFQSPEIQAQTAKLTEIDAKIAERQRAIDEAKALINDNPFYAEATRLGKIAKLDEKSQNDINTLLKEKQNYVDQLNALRSDAETKMNLTFKQYDMNRQEYKDNLDRFNLLLSSGALTNANGTDLAQLSTATGIPTSMIQSIVEKQKQSEVQPQVITSTDDGGNVTYAVVDQLTGKVIGQSSLGKVGKADNSGAGSAKVGSTQYVAENKANIGQFLNSSKNSYGHVDPNAWNDARTAYVNDALGTYEDFIKEYAQFTDPNRGDFSTAYGFGKSKLEDLLGYGD